MNRRPIDEAAAFFALFVTSDWASCHVRGGGIELFVARAAGHANPMIAAAETMTEARTLAAPHLGTLIELAPPGARLAMGERYGALALLDERIELVAAEAGTVARHLAAVGALVEHDTPLVALS